MKLHTWATIVAGGLTLAAPAAFAADMAVKAAPAPPPVYAAPIFTWTGFYIGGFAGGSHGVWTSDLARGTNHGHTEQGADGGEIGGYVGYNFQLPSNIVLGVEADIGNSWARQSNNIYDNDTSYSKYGVFGSARGRLGYAFDRLLVYGTGGLAWANVSNDIQKGVNAGEQFAWDNQTRVGFAVGAGGEYAFTNNVIGRIEYLYSDYGSQSLYNADGNLAKFQNEMHQVRAGLGYKF